MKMGPSENVSLALLYDECFRRSTSLSWSDNLFKTFHCGKFFVPFFLMIASRLQLKLRPQ